MFNDIQSLGNRLGRLQLTLVTLTIKEGEGIEGESLRTGKIGCRCAVKPSREQDDRAWLLTHASLAPPRALRARERTPAIKDAMVFVFCRDNVCLRAYKRLARGGEPEWISGGEMQRGRDRRRTGIP